MWGKRRCRKKKVATASVAASAASIATNNSKPQKDFWTGERLLRPHAWTKRPPRRRTGQRLPARPAIMYLAPGGEILGSLNFMARLLARPDRTSRRAVVRAEGRRVLRSKTLTPSSKCGTLDEAAACHTGPDLKRRLQGCVPPPHVTIRPAPSLAPCRLSMLER